ncbi:hypothetical protein J5U23_02916 [Saccharolobus shibatae B12]|uniref:Uncharacterized protein n=1 Tax=Saccharolobus shibatae (strain ATCC 51178 / DSM 5389 / JCM 8931 / NBRC 15437 / B12) TaxID=523848 RepID=A0A8F5GRC6_SACSH|nr:hypothetical protein [Saccharolobus shibatae]QXJ27134.1 hypothetical protein J5U23_p2916 [Saccharolobus shibatae B12]QXJ30027.1 hypothetical protein J5U23_02916 [Saccharolobus shibatae B12]
MTEQIVLDYVSIYKQVEGWLVNNILSQLPYPKKELKLSSINISLTVDNKIIAYIKFYVKIGYLDIEKELEGSLYLIDGKSKLILK